MLSVAIINLSSHAGLTRELLGRITLALATQCEQHVQPLWQILPPALSFRADAKVPPGSSPLVIFDTPEQAGYYGWHTVSPEGLVYGRVFTAPILAHGGTLYTGPQSVSATLSHELLEMIGDPHVNEWCDNDGDGYSYAEELCDPTQGDAYAVDGISVSNFITPLWFELRGVDGRRFDFLSKLTSPFEVPSGGYCIRRPIGGGEVENVWGSAVPDWVRELKGRPGARTLRRAST